MRNKNIAKKKIRSCIARSRNASVEITDSMVMYWWRLINQVAFNGKLPLPEKIVIRQLRGAYGTCEGRSRSNSVIITIHSGIKTKALFIGTLAHEMVHAFQYHNEIKLTHGGEYLKWKRWFMKNLGIEL